MSILMTWTGNRTKSTSRTKWRSEITTKVDFQSLFVIVKKLTIRSEVMNLTLSELGKIIIFFLPAFAANGAPPVFKDFPCLRKLYVTINVPLLGEHKTWGGVMVSSATGTIIGSLFLLTPFSPYSVFAPVAGFLLGLGSSFGDLAGSFIKRRIDYSPGEYIWFDSLDWLLGAWMIFFLVEGLASISLIGVSLIIFGSMTFGIDWFFYNYTSLKEGL